MRWGRKWRAKNGRSSSVDQNLFGDLLVADSRVLSFEAVRFLDPGVDPYGVDVRVFRCQGLDFVRERGEIGVVHLVRFEAWKILRQGSEAVFTATCCYYSLSLGVEAASEGFTDTAGGTNDQDCVD